MPQVCLSLAVAVALAAVPAAPQRTVWTNDEIGQMPPGQAVSQLGSPIPAAEVPAAEALSVPAYSRETDTDWYRSRLAAVEGELAQVNARMARIRAFLANPRDNAGVFRLDISETGLSPTNELSLLEARRGALLEQASEIADQVRRAGLPPGVLR